MENQFHLKRLKRDAGMRPQLFQLYYEEQMTLQQIGDRFRLTRERIRQIMERLGMPRCKSHLNAKGGEPKFKTIDEYFKHIKNGGQESLSILRRFIAPLKKHCKECGSVRRLSMHHRKYPALSLNDIEIFCNSCHMAGHNKGITINIQREIIKKYVNGQETVELAEEYKLSRGLIYRILSKWNTRKRYHSTPKLKEIEIQTGICNKYRMGKSGVELARDYEVSITPIYRILRQHNVKIRGYASASP